MTANQVAYWNLQESRRSNLANEDIKRKNLSETRRSNLAQEIAKYLGLKETARSNRANETERHRSNVTNEGLTKDRNFYQNLESSGKFLKNTTDASKNLLRFFPSSFFK